MNDIDETITSNLELVSDHIDKIESTVNGLVKDFKERFADKEKKFEKRVIPVTYDKLQELTANSAAFKIKSKELAEKDKKYTKQITTLEEECANLKDLLEHLEKKNSQLNAQADSSKKALQDFERNSARTDELEGLAQSYSLMKQRAEELEKKTSSQDIE